MLKPRCRLWLQKGDASVFGDGRAGLLRAIRRHGTLRAAAAELGMAYRTAWLHLRKMESGLGYALVERRTGGPKGGGMRLTARGERLLERFDAFREAVDKDLRRRAKECGL